MILPSSAVRDEKGDSDSLSPLSLAQLLDECEEAVLLLDDAWRVRYANARAVLLAGIAATDIFNVPLRHLFGVSFTDTLQSAAASSASHIIVCNAAVGQETGTVRSVRNKDGTRSLFFRPHDAVSRNAIVTDAPLQALVNLTSDWVFEVDTENRYSYVSPSVVATLGYEAHELLGRSPFELMLTEYVGTLESEFRRIQATQATFKGLEYASYAKSGEIVFQESSGAPTYDAAGKWTGYRGTKRNITSQKQRELHLESVARKQSRIAETLQRSLLQSPNRVSLPFIEVVTRYEAASPDALIGGDLFDVYQLHDNKVALVVGDVTGKGLEAATEMAEIKFLLRSYLRESPQPESALVRLNRQLFLRRTLNDTGEISMICLSVAVMDTTTGAVQFAVAGMEPPLVIRAHDGKQEPTLELVTVGGLPLGALPAWHMDAGESVIFLAPSDLLLLYTDGVVEARPKETGNVTDPVFGTARLVRAVRDAATLALSATPPLPVAGICDAVLSAVQRFTGVERRDDICLLLARYLPGSLPPLGSIATMIDIPDAPGTIISRCGEDWHYTFISQNVEAFTGRSPAEFLGKTVWEAFPMFVGTEFETLIRRSRRENIALVVDMELLPPGVMYRVSCTPLASGELEIRSLCLPNNRTADLARELEQVSREREIALREREAAVREREAALRENERSREFQRRFLTEVLANVTEGRLRLCNRSEDLPSLLPLVSDPILLSSTAVLSTLRRGVEAAGERIGLPAGRSYELSVATGEAAMNSIVHAGGGAATLRGDKDAKRLQVCISDTGSGIAEEALHRATLERGYTTAGSLGLGFSLMHSVADRVYLLTGSTGTTIILEQYAEPVAAEIGRF